MTLREVEVAPVGYSLPVWPKRPEPVDVSGTSYLVVSFGADSAVDIADGWAGEAALHGPVLRHHADRFEPEQFDDVLAQVTCGVRIMVAGAQDDVLRALSAARTAGAEPEELRSFVTRTDVLGLYCAHCRATSRVEASPGENVTCPACDRFLEIHPHLSIIRGSFLGSDATSRELA